MASARWVPLAALGALFLALGITLIATVDPVCEASGAYGNYCALQQPHVWGAPAGLVGIGLLVAALVTRARAANA